VLVRGPHDLVALADIQTRFPQERLGRFAPEPALKKCVERNALDRLELLERLLATRAVAQ
jgi:hypothetical protein